jgi:tetratricopeptide (TPR) repeat protein
MIMAAESTLPKKILVIDDDVSVTNQIETLLKKHGIVVEKANNFETAIYKFNQIRYDAVILELEFEELPGTVIVQKFRNSDFAGKKEIPIVIMTGIQRSSSEESLMTELEDVQVITKPINLGALLGTLSKSVQLLQSTISFNELKYKVIDSLVNQGKSDRAYQVCKEKLIPMGKKGKYEAALIIGKMGKIDEAIVILEEMHKAEPNNMKYLNDMAKLYVESGDLDKARLLYEKADEIAPHNLHRITEMAGLYLAMKEPIKSIEKYSELIAFNPENKEMKFDIYQKLFEGGFEEHARDFCMQTSTPTELIKHFNNKGVMHSKSLNFDAAISEYSKARGLIPGDKELYRILYNLAIAHINKKTRDDISKAHELLLEVKKMKPSFEKANEKLELTTKLLSLSQRAAG